MSETVLVERRGSVGLLTMNLPHKRNALTAELLPALLERLTELQDDPGIRAIVLSGGRHFCAGGDLSGLDVPLLEMRRAMLVGHRVIRAVIGGQVPVIAAVEGNAYGAGFSLAMGCDFVVADEQASFCAAFGRVGLMPDYGLLWTLPQRVSIGVAREIIMLCEPIPGARAHQLGLVDRLSGAGEVLQAAMSMAERLTLAPPATLATTRAALARAPLSLDAMLSWEADTQAMLVHSEDFREGVQAFQQKRPPRFRGR